MALGDIAVYPFSFPEKLLRKRGSAEFRVCKGPAAGKRQVYDGTLAIERGTEHWPAKKFDTWTSTLKQLGYTCLIPALRWSTDYRGESALAEAARKEAGGGMLFPPPGIYREVYAARGPRRRGQLSEGNDLAKRETLFETSASVVRDGQVIQRIIDLDYKGLREKNPVIRKVLEKIAVITSEITDGFPIEFLGVAEDEKGLYPEFKTPDGKLPINVLSQGTQSVIQWIGLLLIGYAEYYGFPPSWQRRIVPALSSHFPKLQIFFSSHSPLVLAGLKAGQAQLLKRDKKGKVVVSRNETDIIGWSTDEILRNFLDITNPTDLRTNDNIQRLQELRRKRRLTPVQKKELEKLRVTVGKDLVAGPVRGDVERFAQIIQKRAGASASPKRRKIAKKAKKESSSRTKRAQSKRTRAQN
jgi:hypothetical protein